MLSPTVSDRPVTARLEPTRVRGFETLRFAVESGRGPPQLMAQPSPLSVIDSFPAFSLSSMHRGRGRGLGLSCVGRFALSPAVPLVALARGSKSNPNVLQCALRRGWSRIEPRDWSLLRSQGAENPICGFVAVPRSRCQVSYFEMWKVSLHNPGWLACLLVCCLACH